MFLCGQICWKISVIQLVLVEFHGLSRRLATHMLQTAVFASWANMSRNMTVINGLQHPLQSCCERIGTVILLHPFSPMRVLPPPKHAAGCAIANRQQIAQQLALGMLRKMVRQQTLVNGQLKMRVQQRGGGHFCTQLALRTHFVVHHNTSIYTKIDPIQHPC